MRLNGILSQLNILVHIPLTELRWFYIQEKRNSFKKFISMFVASNLTPRAFEILLSVSSLQNRRFMSQARRTRYLALSAKWVRSMRRGEEKNKAYVTSPLFWLFPRSLHERGFPVGLIAERVVLARFSGMFPGTKEPLHHAFMFFWRCCSRSLFSYFQMLQKQKKNKRNV